MLTFLGSEAGLIFLHEIVQLLPSGMQESFDVFSLTIPSFSIFKDEKGIKIQTSVKVHKTNSRWRK